MKGLSFLFCNKKSFVEFSLAARPNAAGSSSNPEPRLSSHDFSQTHQYWNWLGS